MTFAAGRRFASAFFVFLAAGPSFALTFTFSSTNQILISDSTSPPTKAATYPSALGVTGLTGQLIVKATVTLTGFTHEYPSDVTMLLVGPSGEKTIVLSETGGQVPLSVTNLTLTLDDDAASSLPIYSRLSSGVFKPTNGYLTLGHTNLPYDLPSPAPPANSNALARLGLFKNTDASGAWSLFIVDDASGSTGAISNGWTLSLEMAVPLTAARLGTNIVISWPGSAQNATLQSATGLNGAWTDLPQVPVLISNRWTVTNAIASGARWFRLRSN